MSFAMIITIAAIAIGPPGLPRSPEQKLLSCSEIASRASSEALFKTACFHGVFGIPSWARWSRSRICCDMW
eukprot:2792216-Prymnesium_polylepis.1